MAGDNKEEKKYSRRDFVIGSGTAIAGGAFTAIAAATPAEAAEETTYPLSTMYLVYDSRHCAGCLGCMLACSMVHEGMTSFSLSRIQVHRTVLAKYPLDIQQNVCRQCPDPLCVKHCPVGAAHVSAQNGNIRMIDEAKCIGCQNCIKSCPHIPHRPIWNPAKNKSTKCDMCVNTPFYNKKGGVGGTQACVEACPANALKIVNELPSQADLSGYDRDLQPAKKSGELSGFGASGATSKPKAEAPSH
jgi:protein NrfC